MPKSFIGANVLIIGDGISGRGAKFALEKRGAHCFLYDEKVYAAIPKIKFDSIVVSPSIPRTHAIFTYAHSHGIPVLGELELGYRFSEGKVIAVTGTNGKTTVTELIGAMLQNAGIAAAVCGNIGVSFARTAVEQEYDTAVVEVSSFQLETTDKFRPHIACITNISPDHLDRHGTMAEYARTKLRIAEKQTESDYLVLSADDIPLGLLQGFSPRAQVLYTSLRRRVNGAYLLDGNVYYGDEKICERDTIRLLGDHNVANVLTAICAARLSGVPNEVIVKVVSTFQTDAHRVQLVAHKGGKTYYNDSKGTNIAATLRACEAVPADVCLIAGGSDKGYAFDELFTGLPDSVTRILAIGQTAQGLAEAAARCGYGNLQTCETLLQAVMRAAAGREQTVLLSPAAASFDMFQNYEERGRIFEQYVRELKEEN